MAYESFNEAKGLATGNGDKIQDSVRLTYRMIFYIFYSNKINIS
jgi:hypothetical protein